MGTPCYPHSLVVFQRIVTRCGDKCLMLMCCAVVQVFLNIFIIGRTSVATLPRILLGLSRKGKGCCILVGDKWTVTVTDLESISTRVLVFFAVSRPSVDGRVGLSPRNLHAE